MREVEKIPQKRLNLQHMALLLTALLVIFFSLSRPSETGKIIREALLLFASRVLPSLFCFSVASKLLMGAGFMETAARSPLRHLFRWMGLSAGGGSAFLMGLVCGFPMGAYILADGVRGGSVREDEAARLLPFANNAGAAFVVGAVGVGVFGSAKIGRMLFLAQSASALLGAVLFSRGGEARQTETGCPRALPSVFVDAISRGATGMVSLGGYIVFFSLLSHIFCALLPEGPWTALLAGVLELSGGVFRLETLHISLWIKLFLCGVMLGFGGLSVFFQAADGAESARISLRFYLWGKLFTAGFCGIFSPLFVLLGEQRGGGWGIFAVFVFIFVIKRIKNKINFKKSMEKREGMLYNKYEIHCPQSGR